jgi:hypothetical protein
VHLLGSAAQGFEDETRGGFFPGRHDLSLEGALTEGEGRERRLGVQYFSGDLIGRRGIPGRRELAGADKQGGSDVGL